jgi:hypothetical protein
MHADIVLGVQTLVIEMCLTDSAIAALFPLAVLSVTLKLPQYICSHLRFSSNQVACCWLISYLRLKSAASFSSMFTPTCNAQLRKPALHAGMHAGLAGV